MEMRKIADERAPVNACVDLQDLFVDTPLVRDMVLGSRNWTVRKPRNSAHPAAPYFR